MDVQDEANESQENENYNHDTEERLSDQYDNSRD